MNGASDGNPRQARPRQFTKLLPSIKIATRFAARNPAKKERPAGASCDGGDAHTIYSAR